VTVARQFPIDVANHGQRPRSAFGALRLLAVTSDHVELDTIKDGVAPDRSRMRRAFAEGLSISLARSTHVCVADRVERDQIDRIDLDVDVAHSIYPSDSHLWPLPKPKGDGDAACDDLVAKFSTELHRTDYRGASASAQTQCLG
jgi:hypothetical protein